MIKNHEFEIVREDNIIVKKYKNGQFQTIVDLGDVVYVSQGSRTGYGRHILNKDNVWMDSSGKTYIWAGGIVSCSSGQVWKHVFSKQDAELIVKSDV